MSSTNPVVLPNDNKLAAVESILIRGDLAILTPEQRVLYAQKLCDSLGLNHLSRPFDYITLQGRLVLYAKKDCAEQLRKLHNVSITVLHREHIKSEGIYLVTVRARTPDGREDESTGVVVMPENTLPLDKANLIMKCETKAKRRATLSICGLGILDVSEVEDIPEKDKLPRIFPEDPGEGNGVLGLAPGDYLIPGGTYVKRRFHEINARELGEYIVRREAFYKKKPDDKPFWWEDFVVRAEGYLGDLENQPLEREPGEEG